jgi:hypothetical protein
MICDNIIPLGDHCAISMILKEFNLRKKSYPFDWCAHIEAYESNILSNIEYLLELLEFKNIDSITCKLIGNTLSNNDSVYNNLTFPHEFGNIEETNNKYKRRFIRLYDDINNKNKNIYIIVTRFIYIPEDIFNNLYNKLIEYNSDSYIILISGINHEYKNTYSNFDFKYIPYDKKDFFNFDYSGFRPEIKKYLISKLL